MTGLLDTVKEAVIPTGTGPKADENSILKKLNSLSFRNFSTLKDVVLTGVNGEPIDDKTYLMEHVIQLTSGLPLHDKLSDTLTNKFLHQLWDDLDHPPNSYLGHDYSFRTADGSNNNIQWPHIGQAKQPYARSVKPQKMQPVRPDPETIFNAVLKRDPTKFEKHPNGISSVLFYTASIIIHDCFHTSHKDYAISDTSSYLDLAPLYGSNKKQQDLMRTFKNGKLKADCFSDSRIHGFPPGVGVMLIMFNRFHNNVVENLARIDEGGRFSQLLRETTDRRRTGLVASVGPGEETPSRADDYDEALFQTGRLITTGLYVNIVLQDYVRTILGLNHVDSLWNLDPRADAGNALGGGERIAKAVGNQVSAEFSLVYRWHACVSQRDDKWTSDFMKNELKLTEKPKNMFDLIKKMSDWADDLARTSPEDRPWEGLKRDPDGTYDDAQLFKIWADSVDDTAGAFGAQHVPENLMFVEILSMMQARSWNLASLNEFRQYFKLAPHKTFKDINPDPHVSEQLERLYGHPDNVELYPGIVVESAKVPMSPGSGLCASWTTSRAILADAVALVRGDRFHTVEYNPRNLTNWGYQTAHSDLNINWGGVFYKLVLNAFSNGVPKNSIYAHFPLVVPEMNKKILKDLKRADQYNFTRPVVKDAPIEGDKMILNQPAKFESAWSARGGNFSAEKTNPTADVKMSFAEAVLENEKWKSAAETFYKTTVEKLLKDKSYQLGGYQTVDIVADVLNAAHASFITSVLGIPLAPKEGEGSSDTLLRNLGNIYDHAYGAHPAPHSLKTDNRSFFGWIADKVHDAFVGKPTTTNKENEIGQAAFAKLKEVNGADAKTLVLQDILPTSAFLLTGLSRSSATAVTNAIPSNFPGQPQAVLPPKPSADASLPNMKVAMRATSDTDTAKAGQIVMVDVAAAHNDGSAGGLTPAMTLVTGVAEICNKAVASELNKLNGVMRMPGDQGKIKVIKGSSGDERYLNKTESEYVPYPVSMKIRWKA